MLPLSFMRPSFFGIQPGSADTASDAYIRNGKSALPVTVISAQKRKLTLFVFLFCRQKCLVTGRGFACFGYQASEAVSALPGWMPKKDGRIKESGSTCF